MGKILTDCLIITQELQGRGYRESCGGVGWFGFFAEVLAGALGALVFLLPVALINKTVIHQDRKRRGGSQQVAANLDEFSFISKAFLQISTKGQSARNQAVAVWNYAKQNRFTQEFEGTAHYTWCSLNSISNPAAICVANAPTLATRLSCCIFLSGSPKLECRRCRQ